MAITPNRLYPQQMNGPVISANGIAVDDRFSDAEAIQTYLHNLSIDTADDTELDSIGLLVGYPRPLVPEGFNAENIMLLGTLPLASDEEIGLSTINSRIGGELSTVVTSDTNFMSSGMYRKFLKSVAQLKRYGITLNSIDKIAATISDNYELEYDENGDITIAYGENIGFKNIWILTQLFYRIATAPQVLITAEEGE